MVRRRSRLARGLLYGLAFVLVCGIFSVRLPGPHLRDAVEDVVLCVPIGIGLFYLNLPSAKEWLARAKDF